MPFEDQNSHRAAVISLLIFVILCIPLCFFVLAPPPKTFFFWLNDDVLSAESSTTGFKQPDESSSHADDQTPDDKESDAESPPLLLLISYDAFRYDYVEKHKNVTPTFQWLIEHGVYSPQGLKNTFITITAPNHYGIVTGLYEESHGIIANSFFDPVLNASFDYFDARWATDPRFFGGMPIWHTNDQAGPTRSTGCVMWVGCDVRINGTARPDHWVSWNVNLDWAARVDALISWFTDPKKPINFGLLYIEEPDETGHSYGPDSYQLIEMLRKLDQLTAYLLWRLHASNLLDKVNIIFTADHGMASVPVMNVVNMDKYINRSMYTAYGGTPNWNVRPAKGQEQKVYDIVKKIPHLNVYNKSTIPNDFHYRNSSRIMELQLVADVHWWISHNYTGAQSANGTVSREIYVRGQKKLVSGNAQNFTTGEHGYNNSLPEMHPYFIAHGPAFKKGFNITHQIMNIDLYELMCYILQVKPAPNNGSFARIKSILKDEGRRWAEKESTVPNWRFFSFWSSSSSSRSLNDIDVKIDYEFSGIKSNFNVDIFLMLFILICYMLYMIVMIRGLKHRNRKCMVNRKPRFEIVEEKKEKFVQSL